MLPAASIPAVQPYWKLAQFSAFRELKFLSEYDTTLACSVTHGSIGSNETENLSDDILMREWRCVSFHLLIYSDVIGDYRRVNHGRRTETNKPEARVNETP